MKLLTRIAECLRHLADFIDPAGQMRAPGVSMMFVRDVGVVIVPDYAISAKFCRLWYRTEDHDKAYKPDSRGRRNDYYSVADIPVRTETSAHGFPAAMKLDFPK